MAIGKEEIENRFGFHKGTLEGPNATAPRHAALRKEFRAFADRIGVADWIAIPVSGLNGDNVADRGAGMPWYAGPTLLEHLDTVPLSEDGEGPPAGSRQRASARGR